MTLQINRHDRQMLAMFVLAFTGLAGCHDAAVAPHRVPPPPDHLTNLGTVIVEVNTKTGEVTTHPYASASADAPPGVDAAIYGAASLIGHTFQLRNGTHTTTWSLDDHIENFEPFAIGTRIPHTLATLPADTMGVYVFMSIAPTVLTGCTPNPTTCTVKADSGYDGNFAFTAPAQPYIYFKTILEPNDGVLHSGQDFSGTAGGVNYFRTFSFRTSPGVTNFKFGVSVSAAFVQPNDTRWSVTYFGDSLPNRVGTGLADLRSEPDWRVRGSAVFDTSIATAGCAGAGVTNCLRIQNKSPSAPPGTTDTLIYYRSDSLGTSDSAFMEATVADSGLVAGQPSVTFGMQDGVKAIAFGIASASAGFVQSGNAFVTNGSGVVNPATTTTWRIRKFAHDSVVAYADGVKIVNVPYASLPAAPAAVAK
ncbi:MAG TPA: hypothetical protein VKP02_07125, partial [Gemmatimonadaceae bacterium]|nr:hypothetical protein [Gemmatimonadaceae bacterium]